MNDTYISQSCTSSAFGSRKRVSRSPYQRKKPVTANSSANAAVTIAFSFCPAFSRPCGAGRPPEPRAVVGVEAIDLARRPPQRAAVAGDDDDDERDRPGDRGVDVDRLQERPPADELGEARQVEAEARREQHAGTRSRGPSAPPARCARSAASRRGSGSGSHSTGRPRRSGRSRGLPSSRSADGRRAPSAPAT